MALVFLPSGNRPVLAHLWPDTGRGLANKHPAGFPAGCLGNRSYETTL